MQDRIAYQNKDITSKILAETFVGKSLNAYGLNLPRVRRVLPTNLPAILADELRLDNLFELEDGSVALIDYESGYRDLDKITYGQYMMRVAERFRKEGQDVPQIRLVIIYTADVERRQVSPIMDRTGFVIRMEAAFLSELDSEAIRARLTAKVERGEPLDEEETMQFIILPLSYRDREEKLAVLQESVALAERIEDTATARFILSGLVVFSDKIIDNKTRERAWRAIKMTQIGRMFLDEMEEREAKVRKEVTEQVTKQVTEQVTKQVTEQVTEQVTGQVTEQVTEQVTRRMTDQMRKQADQMREQADRMVRQAEQARAELLIHMVESLAKSEAISAEDACQKLGVPVVEYANTVLRIRSGDAA